MSRTISLLNAGLFTLALALPAAAAPFTSSSANPSCDPKGEKDGKKNPSAADAQCDGPKGEKKDEKKNPSLADAECGGGQAPKGDTKGGKNPSSL